MHLFPRLLGSRAFSALALAALSLASLSGLAPAHAGSYIGPVYTGGIYTAPSPQGVQTPYPYSLTGTNYGGASGGAGPPSCTGTITTTFTWQPAAGETIISDPPPATVIVIESCTVSVTTNYPGSSGAYNTGLGQSGSVGFTLGGNNNSVTVTGIRYTAPAGSPTITLQETPSATATTIGADSSLSYTAALVSPRITLVGTTKDNSGANNILIGRNCTAILDLPNRPPSFTLGTPTWSIPGDVFTAFVISSDQTMGEAFPYPDPRQTGTPIQPEFYWRDANGVISGFAPEIISVMAPVYNTIGNTVTFVGDVSAQKPINVWVPDEYDTPAQGSVPKTNPQLGTVGFGIDADAGVVVSNAAGGNGDGYDLEAAVITPALFTANGFGEWAWLQQCQINVTKGGNLTQMATPELDSSFPYNTVGGPGNGILGTPNVAQADPKGYTKYDLFPDSPN